ncbi:MAG: Hsp20 family protein [Bacteroidetes bacterium]|nr:Hsp20 family protein [Bacteroidota bacterium]
MKISISSSKNKRTVPRDSVIGDKIEAKYTEGILNVIIPKREEVKPQPEREIKIS